MTTPGGSRSDWLVYKHGHEARTAGAPKSAPGYLTWGQRHWWLAGWNDCDMEIGQ